MKMQNVPSHDDAIALYRTADRAELIGQQIGLRSSIHCLEWLIANAEEATPQMILESLRTQLHSLHEVAHERGIELCSYE